MQTTVSIIEDNSIIRDNVRRFIAFHDEFHVSELFGQWNLLCIKMSIDPRWKADVMLLDIGLPGMSGLEGIPKLREKCPEMDIIMLTTYEEEDKILRALCSGACAYISKKANLEEIVDAIRIVINGGSYMSP